MPDFLQQMMQASTARAAEARARTSAAEMRTLAEQQAPARKLDMRDFALIAEIKRASPSAGELAADVNIGKRAAAYEAAGAAAISVLTEPAQFKGNLADLREAREAVGCPVMRKDFLVEAYQLYEARANGADGVLLMAALMGDGALKLAIELCDYLRMFALVEAFDETEVERCQQAGAHIVGINCRNLRDLSVDFARFERLRPLIDKGRIAIAESGITTATELQAVRELGYHGALVGSALMREADPVAAIGRLRGRQ